MRIYSAAQSISSVSVCPLQVSVSIRASVDYELLSLRLVGEATDENMRGGEFLQQRKSVLGSTSLAGQ